MLLHTHTDSFTCALTCKHLSLSCFPHFSVPSWICIPCTHLLSHLFVFFFQILFDAVLKILNKCTDHIFKPLSLSIIMNNELFSYHSVHVWSSAGLRDTNDGRQTFTICPGFVRFIWSRDYQNHEGGESKYLCFVVRKYN